VPRVNRPSEQLEQAQTVRCTGVREFSYDAGLEAAGTWADYLSRDLEHGTVECSQGASGCCQTAFFLGLSGLTRWEAFERPK